MIKVDVMDICHHCALFEADSDANKARNAVELFELFCDFNSEGPTNKDTPDITVRCKNHARCEYIINLLTEHLKTLNGEGDE